MRRTALFLPVTVRHYLVYILLRAVSYPLSFLPFSLLQKIGRGLGFLGYHAFTKYRKRALSNLALAKKLNLTQAEREKVAIQAFQNLMMTMMELARLLWRPQDFSALATCEKGEVFEEPKKLGKGVVLLSAHQANWEIGVFDLLPGSTGVTIGRPLANRFLYSWILKMRERNGNQVVPPQNGLQTGIAALNEGKFFALFGDQAKVTSDYHAPFLGSRAWTSQSPAILAYKTGSPLCVIAKKRVGAKHLHTYSSLIWPDRAKPWKEEVKRMMDEALSLVEESIKAAPGEWLWQHRRWKQGMALVKKKYRHDFILLVFPVKPVDLRELEVIYPRAFFTAMVPDAGIQLPAHWKKIVYQTEKELFIEDWSFQLVIDFLGVKGLKEHYLSLGAFEVINHIPN